MFWVYILENAGSKFYIGQTDEPQARLPQNFQRLRRWVVS